MRCANAFWEKGHTKEVRSRFELEMLEEASVRGAISLRLIKAS